MTDPAPHAESCECAECVTDETLRWVMAGGSVNVLRARTHDPDEPPDFAGAAARCPACGTSVGPVTANAGVSIRLGCSCGNVLEAFPNV